MKAKLCLRLCAVGVLLFAGIASAAPPGNLSIDRYSGNTVDMGFYSYVPDTHEFRYKGVRAYEAYTVQGTYQYSEIYVYEHGWSPTEGWISRYASCQVPRDALVLQIGRSATMVSLSAYVSAEDLANPSCYSEGYTELAVNASLSAPLYTRRASTSGAETSTVAPSYSYKFACRETGGHSYQGAVSVNGESWAAGGSTIASSAYSSDCNNNYEE